MCCLLPRSKPWPVLLRHPWWYRVATSMAAPAMEGSRERREEDSTGHACVRCQGSSTRLGAAPGRWKRRVCQRVRYVFAGKAPPLISTALPWKHQPAGAANSVRGTASNAAARRRLLSRPNRACWPSDNCPHMFAAEAVNAHDRSQILLARQKEGLIAPVRTP